MYYDENDSMWVGTSSEKKPTDQANGIYFYETDTGNTYVNINKVWKLSEQGMRVGSLILSPTSYLWADPSRNIRMKNAVPEDKTDGHVVMSQKVMLTPEGGIAVKMINKTGADTVKGMVVTTSRSADMGVQLITINVPDPIGVFYESGIADGQEAWVVISGIADVMFVDSTTRGYLVRGFITGEATYEPGKALAEAVPTSPFASDKHFYEVGHLLESRTGPGLAKVVLHFN